MDHLFMRRVLKLLAGGERTFVTPSAFDFFSSMLFFPRRRPHSAEPCGAEWPAVEMATSSGVMSSCRMIFGGNQEYV